MAIEFKLPNLGENIESGDVVNVLVKEGDEVKANQGVLEIETDKAVIEVPTTQGGRVSKVHVKAGQTIKIGSTVLTLEPVGAASGKSAGQAPPAKRAATDRKPEPQAAKAAQPQAAVQSKAPAPAAKQSNPPPAQRSEPPAPPQPATSQDGNGRSRSSAPKHTEPTHADAKSKTGNDMPAPAGPEVRRLARELGVDLARVSGSGGGGRITREDVIAAVRQANLTGAPIGARDEATKEHDQYGPIEREQLSRTRKTIAANMLKSVQTIPQLTNFDDADITELEQWRKESAADYEKEKIKLTSLAFVLKAVALSLKEHRTLNATLDLEAGQAIYKHYVNIGVAVDTERGLIVPVMRDVDRLSIKEIASALGALGQKARAGQTAVEEMRGASFSISNLGAIGGVYSTPIINPGEVGILLVGRARKLPVVVEGDRIEPRLMMPLSLTYDHRIVDGAAAARFLNEVIDFLEAPRRLLLA
jgi:pyruvate/2-oxoglutarate dehydrogenase complex dihydrolipoamide acyltransferase (E2) component